MLREGERRAPARHLARAGEENLERRPIVVANNRRTAVVAAGRILTLQKGEKVYRPGESPGGIIAVVEGGILMSTFGRDGTPLPGRIARRCHWFGYGSVLDKQRGPMMTVVNEPLVVLHVPLIEFERLREEFPASARAYGNHPTLGEALHLAALADFLIRDNDRRQAAVLLRVSGAEPPRYRHRELPAVQEGDGWANPRGVPLTQALLGDFANAASHTVARCVDRATRAGWIDWTYGRVRIPATIVKIA